MKRSLTIQRTTSNDPGFQKLIAALDHELWNELKEDQSTYDQYNKVSGLNTVVIAYRDNVAAGCGCFKKYTDDTVEIKRMFVEKKYRRQGVSKIVLKELEDWAMESSFQYAILETSVHFKAARSLYENAGYIVTENYDQYIGLEESICMKKELKAASAASEFKDISGIEYFSFEEDFIEKNIRCIPMIVRFKMDSAGIKLKLEEWSRFSVEERIALAKNSCRDKEEAKQYNKYLSGLIKKYSGTEATALEINDNPDWADLNNVPAILQAKMNESGGYISAEQWKGLTDLQRFALVKLCREGHENKNFPKAVKEFAILS